MSRIILERDIIGLKPMFYCTKPSFAFASERKILEKKGFIDIIELDPRKVLIYDNGKIEFKEKKFFDVKPEVKDSELKIRDKVKELLIKAVKKRISKEKLGILFSGGVDSTTLLQICKDLGKDVILYTAAVVDKERKLPEDLEYAKRAARYYNCKLRIKIINTQEAENYLKKVVPIIESNNPVKVGVGLTLYLACELAKKDRCKVIFSGLGSEEIFAGYERHRLSRNVNKECVNGLLQMYERDLYRDNMVTKYNNLELRVPFLDEDLVAYSLRIPSKYKLKGDSCKVILRKVAEDFGVPKEFAWRKKRAAQYGSNTHKAIKKLAKKKGFEKISEYLRQFYPSRNLKLAALYSSGKDSSYALWIMQKNNYDVRCL
ncbi:ATP-binding protein, partial [Candidatus Woesearchaeota archaeon]|nr:ATP-binding protein [Candidatus Woesearchaeota archaeon]